METWIFSLVVNAILGIVSWTMKSTLDELREQLRTNRIDIDHVKDKYFKKEDFQEFKGELWRRLDKFEADIKSQLRRD